MALLCMLVCCGFLQAFASTKDTASAKRTPLPVEVIEEEGQAQTQAAPYTAEKIEAACEVTPARLWGLAGLWIAVIFIFLLIRIQLRDDEALIKQGYYGPYQDHT